MADPVITTLRILGTRAYINGARASARAIKEVGRASDETGHGMQLFKGTLGGVTGALGIMSSAAKSAATILGALTLYGAKVGLEFDASIERAQIGMETLLGSSKQAKKVVQAVQDFAVKAPMLSVADAVQSTQMLIGAGLKAKDAVPTMQTFSDTLSAMGRRPEDLQRMTYAFMQMMSKGKITAEELRGQLGEIFPASKLLAKGMGISMQELQERMKEGGVKGMKPIMILLDQMEKKFGGATKRSATTFSGQLNNIKENAKVILGDIFRPLFEMMRDKLFPWVDKIAKRIGDWAKAGGMKRIIGNIAAGFQNRRAGQPGAVARRRGLGQAGERMAQVRQPQKGKGWLDKASFTLGQIAGKVLPEVKKAAMDFWDALKPAKPFLDNVLIPFVAGFGVGLWSGIKALIPLIKIVAQVLGWIGQKAKPIKPLIAGIGYVLGFAFGPGKIGIFRLFGKVFRMVGGWIGRVFQFIGERSTVINRIGIWFLNLAGRIPSIAGKIVSALTAPFRFLGKKISGFISGAVGSVISAIVSFGTQIADALWNALPEWMKKLLTVGAKGFVAAIKAAAGKAKPGTRGTAVVVDQRKVNRKNRGNLFQVPRRAEGGWTSGLTLVGEQGPELAEFPSNTYIHPAPKMPSIPAMNIQLHAPIYWKGREVAKAVAEDTSDKKARR